MSGTGDRLHDVRRRPTFEIEKAALELIPQVGPAAWAVYCYLISLATEGDSRWPSTLSIASACGISTYNAENSIDALLSAGLIVRHRWTTDPEGRVSFAIVPVGQAEAMAEVAPVEMQVEQPQGTDRLVSEDAAEDDDWSAETEERSQARELFSRMLDSLDVEPGDLSERARTTATEASRLARAAGATPDEITEMIDRIRDVRPEMVKDAEQMLDYWSRLFEEMPHDPDHDPD